jgi:hypothetical protein
MVARPTMAMRRYRVFLTSLGQGDSSRPFRRRKDLLEMLRRRCLDLEGRVPSSMSTTETFNSGSALSKMSCRGCCMAGCCNQNGTLGPPNVSSSKVVNHNVVSLELEIFAGTSSPYQGCIRPSLLNIPNYWFTGVNQS